MALQIGADQYATFVAMRFGNVFSYNSDQVYHDVIQAAAEDVNKRNVTKRKFALPKRVDDNPGQAFAITEEIVVGILEAHIFLADLTFENQGVLIETGLALALKPNRQIILISQGFNRDLHFDIKDNQVIFYEKTDAVPKIANALIAAAQSFEKEAEHYLGNISRILSPPAIRCLRWFAKERQTSPEQSLHAGVAKHIFNAYPQETEHRLLFQMATQELLSHKMIYTDYRPLADDGKNDDFVDMFGMGTTRLGTAFTNYFGKAKGK